MYEKVQEMLRIIIEKGYEYDWRSAISIVKELSQKICRVCRSDNTPDIYFLRSDFGLRIECKSCRRLNSYAMWPTSGELVDIKLSIDGTLTLEFMSEFVGANYVERECFYIVLYIISQDTQPKTNTEMANYGMAVPLDQN